MASSVTNTADEQAQADLVDEPSMDDILASIKQIIADDEAPEDGLSERERYSHPTSHSNSNELDETLEADLNAAMEEEVKASIAAALAANRAPVETVVNPAEHTPAANAHAVRSQLVEAPVEGSPAIPSAVPVLSKTPPATKLEDRVAQVRSEVSAAGAGLSSDERLEKYRVRGKLQMETLAAEKAQQAKMPPPPPPVTVAPVVAAGPMLPTTNAIAEKMAATMMSEKSKEIESLLTELMRPTIRQWLSDNLPSMVEKLVREEIERVSRGKRTS